MIEKDWCQHTTIHTRVNERYRISSVWRVFGNANFEQWAWETFVFERLQGKEEMYYEPDSCLSINEVMKIHKILYDKILNGEPLENKGE